RCATSRRMNSRISPSNSLGVWASSPSLPERTGAAAFMIVVPVIERVSATRWNQGPSTADDYGGRIWPLEAEFAAKSGPTLTVCLELILFPCVNLTPGDKTDDSDFDRCFVVCFRRDDVLA